MGEGED